MNTYPYVEDSVLTLVSECVSVSFPVLSIKISDLDIDRERIKALCIDIYPVRIRSRCIKGLHTTNFAERVGSDHRTKAIRRDVLFSMDELKARPWNDEV